MKTVFEKKFGTLFTLIQVKTSQTKKNLFYVVHTKSFVFNKFEFNLL